MITSSRAMARLLKPAGHQHRHLPLAGRERAGPIRRRRRRATQGGRGRRQPGQRLGGGLRARQRLALRPDLAGRARPERRPRGGEVPVQGAPLRGRRRGTGGFPQGRRRPGEAHRLGGRARRGGQPGAPLQAPRHPLPVPGVAVGAQRLTEQRPRPVVVVLLGQQPCQIDRGPRGQPPPDFSPLGETRFEERAGPRGVTPARCHVAQQAQGEGGVASRAEGRGAGEDLFGPRPRRGVVALVEGHLREPEPGQRLHPGVAGRLRARQALQEEGPRGRARPRSSSVRPSRNRALLVWTPSPSRRQAASAA